MWKLLKSLFDLQYMEQPVRGQFCKALFFHYHLQLFLEKQQDSSLIKEHIWAFS